jgi:hypothetical protein
MEEKQFTGLLEFPITAEAQIIVINDSDKITEDLPRITVSSPIKTTKISAQTKKRSFSQKIRDWVVSLFNLLPGLPGQRK